jgi:hypothetical protein
MAEKISRDYPAEERSELRKTLEKLQSVELKLPSLPIYLFKLKDTSPNGMCFLVKEDSAILEHIEVGQIINLRYHSEDSMKPPEILSSEIKHITKSEEGQYKGHYLVGMMILDRPNQSWP